MITIRPAEPQEVKRFLGLIPNGLIEASGAFDGEEMIGICGIIRDPLYAGTWLEDEADLFAFFEMKRKPEDIGLRAILAMADALKRYSEPLFVWCDDAFPTAEKLLHILGFRPTGQTRGHWREAGRKLRIWMRWLPSA